MSQPWAGQGKAPRERPDTAPVRTVEAVAKALAKFQRGAPGRAERQPGQPRHPTTTPNASATPTKAPRHERRPQEIGFARNPKAGSPATRFRWVRPRPV